MKTNSQNLSQQNYLFTYDCINKCNLINAYTKPKIVSIGLTIKLKNFLKASELPGLSQKDKEIQLKAFFLFFFFLVKIS